VAKRGKKVGRQHYEPKYKEEFKQFMKPGKKEPQTFLGFKLKNVNQNWNWKTLEDIL
jgi:hypothetical protein